MGQNLPPCFMLSRSVLSDSVTPWTAARQALLSMDFSMQELRSGWICPPPGNLPDTPIELRSPALQADSLPSESPGMASCFRHRGNWIRETNGFRYWPTRSTGCNT